MYKLIEESENSIATRLKYSCTTSILSLSAKLPANISMVKHDPVRLYKWPKSLAFIIKTVLYIDIISTLSHQGIHADRGSHGNLVSTSTQPSLHSIGFGH